VLHNTILDWARPRGGLKKALEEVLVAPAPDARGRAFGGRGDRLAVLFAHLIHQVPLFRREVSSGPASKVGGRAAIRARGVLVPKLLEDWRGHVKEGRLLHLEEGGCFY